MPIAHAPKAGALLTGAEWESEDTHIVTGTDFMGVLVQRTTDFTTTNANDSIPDFDTVIYDTSGEAWEGVTNQERITIPAAWDGLYMQFYAGGLWATNTNNYVELKLYKNATRPVGDLQDSKLVGLTQLPPATSFNTQPLLLSPPRPVATGDYFTITFRTPANETLLAYENVSIQFGAWVVK